MSDPEKRAPIGTICFVFSKEVSATHAFNGEKMEETRVLEPAVPRHGHVVEIIQQVREPEQESRADRREAQVERDEPDRVVEPDRAQDVTVLEDHARRQGDPDADDDTCGFSRDKRESLDSSALPSFVISLRLQVCVWVAFDAISNAVEPTEVGRSRGVSELHSSFRSEEGAVHGRDRAVAWRAESHARESRPLEARSVRQKQRGGG